MSSSGSRRYEVIQEALRTHFGEAVFVPTAEERRKLVEALDEVEHSPESLRDWVDVRRGFHTGR